MLLRSVQCLLERSRGVKYLLRLNRSPLRYQSAIGAFSTLVPSFTAGGLSQRMDLPDWAGADPEALVYASLERFEPVDIIHLSGHVFNAPVRTDLVHRVVHWQRAKRRAGSAKTKNRGEVKGTTRKAAPQKGRGRARVGDMRSPIWKGGGTVHGPTGKKIWDYPLPLKVRRLGLCSALTSKFANGKLWIVDSIVLSEAKTRIVQNIMEKLRWRSALVIDHCDGEEGEVDPGFRQASHNIRQVLAMAVRGINVYDVLDFEMLVLTKAALQKLEERFAKYEWLT